MIFKRLFNRTQPADPFAVFSQTYHIRIPYDDTPPPKAEPEEPPPSKWVSHARTGYWAYPWVHLVKNSARPTRNSPSCITRTGFRARVLRPGSIRRRG